MKNDISSILEDLYMIDPSLKGMESDLKKMIEKLIEAKPDVQINKEFVKELRQQLMAEMPAKQTNWFSKYIFPFAGGVLATGLVITLIINYMPGGEVQMPMQAERKIEMEEVVMDDAMDENMAIRTGGKAPTEKPAEEPMMLEMATFGTETFDAEEEAQRVFYSYYYGGEQIELPEGSIDWKEISKHLASGVSDAPIPRNALVKEFEVGNPKIIVIDNAPYLKFTVLPNPDSSIYPQEVLVPLTKE